MRKQTIVGKSSLARVNELIEKEKATKIFLVRGKDSFEKSGAFDILEKAIPTYCQRSEFWDFSANPKIEDIKKGIKFFKEFNPDLVLAIGGGSVIDMAKAINFLAWQKESLEKYIMGETSLEPLNKPMIAVPTTAGSGSEETHFAVVYIGKKKYSLKHSDMVPDYAILDPFLTYNLPEKIIAATGMDALVQAIESYWSVNSTQQSKIDSAHGLLIVQLLEEAYKGEKPARDQMIVVANHAGRAINIAQTTACHAISYPITSYFGIPHGHAVALTLGEVLVFNSKVTKDDCNDKRGHDYVKLTINEIVKQLGAKDANDASETILNLMKAIGLKTKLSELGISKEDIELIIKNGFNPDRVKNNPRLLTEKKLKEILVKIY